MTVRPWLCLLALALAAPAAAQTPASLVSREVRMQLAASINNAGLQQSLEVHWRRALTRSSRVVVRDAHASVGVTAAATPASVRGGVWGEVAPLSIVTVRAGVEASQYFGNFNSLWSTDRRDAPFDGDARRDAGGAAAGRAMRWYVTPSLQARAGRWALRAAADFDRWSATAPGPYVYEPSRDALISVSGDRTVSVSTATVYETSRAWRLGVAHQWMRAGNDAATEIQKGGVLIGWSASAEPQHRLRPSVTLNVFRYLDHPQRTEGFGAAIAIATVFARR